VLSQITLSCKKSVKSNLLSFIYHGFKVMNLWAGFSEMKKLLGPMTTCQLMNSSNHKNSLDLLKLTVKKKRTIMKEGMPVYKLI